ncbi:MAG: hypothetical protein FD129_258, partial [bacterium]
MAPCLDAPRPVQALQGFVGALARVPRAVPLLDSDRSVRAELRPRVLLQAHVHPEARLRDPRM